MAVPHVTSFCWCMDLAMGTTFIGYMHLIVSLTLIVVSSVFAAEAGARRGTLEDEDGVYSRACLAAALVAALTAAHVALAVTLLYGVKTGRPRLVRAWSVSMTALVSCGVVYAGGAACAGLSAQGADIYLPLLEALLFFGIMIYSIICVNSYYLFLRSVEHENSATPYHM